MDFKCTPCGEVSPSSEWDKATIKTFGEDIELIEDAFEMPDFAQFWFTCPKCKNDGYPTLST